MDINEVTQGEYLSKKYKLSWVAYVEMILAHIIFIAIVVFCSSFFSHQTIILSCFFVFEAIFIFLVVLSMKAKYVFIDERGVWYHRGILPWTKGVNGILWHDCGGSSYKQGFLLIFSTLTLFISPINIQNLCRLQFIISTMVRSFAGLFQTICINYTIIEVYNFTSNIRSI